MDEVAFLNSEMVQDAVIRNIEIIGEASSNIQRTAPEFAAQHDDIPWQVMYAARNRVSHGYDKVDFQNRLGDDSARPACAPRANRQGKRGARTVTDVEKIDAEIACAESRASFRPKAVVAETIAAQAKRRMA